MDADRNIAKEDILVDIAHLLMLDTAENYCARPCRAIMKALLLFQKTECLMQAFSMSSFEDIHAGIESS